ncbi:MAG: hypothetical protein L6R35_001841 [Caloplaca aegaea]|nr:MAG: hypothetical protein L6R35_001841 [Caloplaca aegaea]
MDTPSGLSSRMSNVIASVLPKIATTVGERSSKGPAKIDLATAENWLARRELIDIYKQAIAQDLDPQTLSYPQGFGGDPELLSSLASFLNTYFRPAIPVEESHIAVAAGASSCLDQLLYTICDAGDSVLVPAPYWNGFDFHLTLRTAVDIVPVSCDSLSHTVSSSLLSALDAVYDAALKPIRIKALIFTNPHNPFGQCYPETCIRDVLRWCGHRRIHFVGDEVYGISEFRRGSPDDRFVSALNLLSAETQRGIKNRVDSNSLDGEANVVSRYEESMNGTSDTHREIGLHRPNGDVQEGNGIDISLVHTIWSLSKDLGCSGLRMATLISQNNNSLLTGVRLLSTPLLSSPSMLMAKALFSSEKLHAIVKLTRVRLARAYQIVEAQLKRWEIEMVEPRAGVFVWARLLKPSQHERFTIATKGALKDDVSGGRDMQQIEKLRNSGVLISPGQQYHLAAWPREQGWVRITFAVEESQLREGLRIIETTLGLGKRRRVVGPDEEEKERRKRRSLRSTLSAASNSASIMS